MAVNFSFTKLANELPQVADEGLSFADKNLKWNTAEDGQ